MRRSELHVEVGGAACVDGVAAVGPALPDHPALEDAADPDGDCAADTPLPVGRRIEDRAVRGQGGRLDVERRDMVTADLVDRYLLPPIGGWPLERHARGRRATLQRRSERG